jgi:hypothetical protein
MNYKVVVISCKYRNTGSWPCLIKNFLNQETKANIILFVSCTISRDVKIGNLVLSSHLERLFYFNFNKNM